MSITPQKVSFNEYGYNATINEHNKHKEHFQNYINKINALNIENVNFEPNDLKTLFSNPKIFFVTKLVTEPTTINGLTLDSSKVFDLLELPTELKKIISDIENDIIFRENDSKDNFYLYASDFLINAGIVEIKQTILDDWKNHFSIFLTTEKQIQINENLNNIIDNLEAIRTVINIDFEHILDKYLVIRNRKDNTEINYQQLKRV